jgi:hypothetical protein
MAGPNVPGMAHGITGACNSPRTSTKYTHVLPSARTKKLARGQRLATTRQSLHATPPSERARSPRIGSTFVPDEIVGIAGVARYGLLSHRSVPSVPWTRTALYHHLKRVAMHSFETFKPMLEASPAEPARAGRDLTNLPVGFGRTALVVGLGAGLQSALFDPASLELDAARTPIPYASAGFSRAYTIADIHDRVSTDRHGDVAPLNTSLTALMTTRKVVADISTWPWATDTLRSFFSTLLLPIPLWLVTRFLGRVV